MIRVISADAGVTLFSSDKTLFGNGPGFDCPAACRMCLSDLFEFEFVLELYAADYTLSGGTLDKV